jgi:KipI family sensor histidine kinase inhibitor
VNVIADGQHAVLVQCDTLAEAASAARHLRIPPLDGVHDVVAAARSVLVSGDAPASAIAAQVGDRLHGWRPSAIVIPTGPTVEIEVRYDGEDLATVAHAAGTTVADVISMHSAAAYTVAFCGFAPGFAYLVGLPPALVLPRRASPRPLVPAGSVAIAGEFSAVYPTASPGGWHLLGRTRQVMFDPHADAPALLVPGAAVRFVPT